MTDKELVHWTLTIIGFRKGDQDLNEMWLKDGIDDEQRRRVRILMEEEGLIKQYIYGNWEFQITSLGIKTKEDDLKEDGRVKYGFWKKIWNDYSKGIVTTLFGVIVGSILTWALAPDSKTIEIPPIKLVQPLDTIYVSKDTSTINSAKNK